MKPNQTRYLVIVMLVCTLASMKSAAKTFVERYDRQPVLDGMDCFYNDVISETQVMSEIQCIRECRRFRGVCVSVFYQSGTGISSCHTCSENYLENMTMAAGLPSLPGSLYYVFGSKRGFQFTWKSSAYTITPSVQTFEEGKDICESYGGYPAVIETSEENDFLKEATKDRAHDCLYIGLYKINGQFVWLKTGEVTTFSDFYHSEPNAGTEESCFIMFSLFNNQWADYVCTGASFPMLCEFFCVNL